MKVSINSKGLRDVEHNCEKEEGIFRIVVLGDSFMEAYQVPLEQSFPRLLEKNLNKRSSKKVEVINLGVGGHGTARMTVTPVAINAQVIFLETHGKKIKHTLVLGWHAVLDWR